MNDKIEELEERVTKMETSFAVMGEQIKNLVKSVDRLTHITTLFAFLLLLTVIWGAIGESGFNAVTQRGAPREARSGQDATTRATPSNTR